MTVDMRGLVASEQMRGEDDEETSELQEFLQRARAFLESHRWCERITDAFFGFGIGGVVAVFLLRVEVKGVGEQLLWCVVGDLPSAYLVTDHAKTAAAALEAYAGLMEDWVMAVRDGTGLRDVYPVDAPADEEHAAMLEDRMRFLRKNVVPVARTQHEQ